MVPIGNNDNIILCIYVHNITVYIILYINNIVTNKFQKCIKKIGTW